MRRREIRWLVAQSGWHIDRKTHVPNPDIGAAVLWRDLTFSTSGCCFRLGAANHHSLKKASENALGIMHEARREKDVTHRWQLEPAS